MNTMTILLVAILEAKTVEKICTQFYWPKMQNIIKDYVLNCHVGQKAKHETKLLAGLLHPMPVTITNLGNHFYRLHHGTTTSPRSICGHGGN